MIIVPQELTDFLSNNITQLYDDYNPETTYTYEEESTLSSASVVRYGNYYYRSVATGNTGNNPVATEGIWWTKYSVSNKFAMLDQQSLTQTVQYAIESDADYLSTDTQTDIASGSKVWDVVNSRLYESLVATNDLPNSDFSDENLWKNKSDIIIEFTRGFIDTLGIGNMEAQSVKIEHYSALGTLIPEATQTIEYSTNEGITDLWSYIYEPYSTGINHTEILYLKPIGTKVKVTISYNTITGYAKCGFLVAGKKIDMGQTQDKIPFGQTSYKKVKKDDFGTTTITKRNVSDKVSFSTYIDRIFFANTRRKVKELDGEIVLFAMEEFGSIEGWEFLVVFGMVEPPQMIAEVATKNIINWQIEETI